MSLFGTSAGEKVDPWRVRAPTTAGLTFMTDGTGGGSWQSAGDPVFDDITADTLTLTDFASVGGALDVAGGAAIDAPDGDTTALAVNGFVLGTDKASGILDLAQVWNTSGTPTAMSVSVTNTASNAASLLIELLAGVGGATSMFKVTALGAGTFSAGLTIAGALAGATTAGLSSTLTITQATANTALVVSTGYSLTGSNATTAIDVAGTWNTSGTPTALKVAITNTASNAASLLVNLLAGAGGVTSMFSVTVAGAGTFAGALAITGALSGVTTAALSSTLTITQGTANTGIIVSTGYSLTGSSGIGAVSYAGTWNTSGTPTALSVAITNTASNAASKLFDFLAGVAGATSLLSLTVTGATTGLLTIGGTYGAGVASLRLNGLTDAAGANVGTLTNSPHTGNPAVWAPISWNGTVYCTPLFALT